MQSYHSTRLARYRDELVLYLSCVVLEQGLVPERKFRWGAATGMSRRGLIRNDS